MQKDTRGRKIEDFYDVWVDVLRVMDLEPEKPYNLISHTCCTAAYTTLIKLFNATLFEGAENKGVALEKAKETVDTLINPTSFQAGGLGMVYGQWIGAVAGSSYSSASMYIKISSFIPRKELELYKYIYNSLTKTIEEETKSEQQHNEEQKVEL